MTGHGAMTSRMTSQILFFSLFLFARLTSQFFFFFVWYDVTIDTGDLSMCLFKVWYRSSSVSAVSQVFPKLWPFMIRLVRSNWNLPGILLGTWGCAFSRFDINRTSGSQVMAIYLPTNDRTRCCVGVADGAREPQPRSPLRVTTYGFPDSDDFVYSNNFSISYAHL